MTLKHIFAIAVAVVAFASCSNDYEVDNLNGLTVSSSYVSLPLAGGANNVNITSNDAWELDTTGTVVKGKKWLEFSSLSGNAGESTLTIKAEATENGRSAEVKLKSGNLVQRIKIYFKPNNAFSPRSTPLNPMKAKDSNPAATSTIGMPLMPLGILT